MSMRTDDPLISVLISTYNASRYIQGCLDSLLQQTVIDELEIIIIDSGSQEDEANVVEGYQSRHPNIHYLRTEYETVYAAWNRGIRIARGKYITNANTDDRLAPHALASLAEALECHPEASLVYADCMVTDTGNASFQDAPITGCFHWPVFDRRLLFQVCFVGPQPMWRRTLHNEHGLFDPSFHSAGDYEFWLRICSSTQFLHINEVLGLYLKRSSSLEHQDSRRNRREAALARQRHWQATWGPLPPTHPGFLRRHRVQEIRPLGHGSDRPSISVIVPTKNRPAQLARALASIAEQTFHNYEVIVVNDGGVDVSDVIAKAHHRERPLRSITHPSSLGAAAARNSGIRMSRGEYIAYLDDDDIYYPRHLEALIHIAKNSGSRFLYSQSVHAQYSSRTGRRIWHRLYSNQHWNLDAMLSMNRIPTLAVMHRKDCLERTGYFDETLKTHEDWDLWIRMMHHFPAAYVAEPTCEFQTRSGPDALTVRHRQNFLDSMHKVHSRYLDLAKNREHVRQHQQAVAQRLESELFGALKILTPTLRRLNNTWRALISILGHTIMPRLKDLTIQLLGLIPQHRRGSANSEPNEPSQPPLQQTRPRI